MKEYRRSNADKIKYQNQNYRQKNKEVYKKYRLNNVDKYNEYSRNYSRRHPIRRSISNKNWRIKNLDYYIKYYKKDRDKHRRRDYANYYNFRRLYCLLDLLEGKEVIATNFHHTDYEANLGFSVCQQHHTIADKWRREEDGIKI